MEEYRQITLNEWASIKESLKRDLIGVQESFVRIGFTLRRIERQELYAKDGYKNITEFAKGEYGLNPSTVSRFMAINRKYSVDGYSDRLRPEFAQMGSSKLSEMLSLPESDMEMINPEATRESIRGLKQFNREEPEEGVADDIRAFIEKFWEDNRELLRELCASTAYKEGDRKRMAETVNPSGSRIYKKGLYFLVMYERECKVKKYGSLPEVMGWDKFFRLTEEIAGKMFGAAGGEQSAKMAAGSEEEKGEILEDHKNAEETREELTEDEAEPNAPLPDEGEDVRRKESTELEEEKDTGKIAPAQKSSETQQESDHKVEPEIEKKEALEEEENAAEIMNSPEKAYKTRKEYMDALSAYEMAHYMAEECGRMNLQEGMLCHPTKLIQWLMQDVDSRGMEIVDI